MIAAYQGYRPRLGENAWVAQSAVVLGQVEIEDEASVWYGCVVRGDVHRIRIGRGTNVQDRCVVHVTSNTHPTIIGDRVTVGHSAILHGCTIADDVLVGMGAIVLDGVEVGAESIVAAGSLLPPRKIYPPRSLVMGNPARVIRQVSAVEVEANQRSAEHYIELAAKHAEHAY